MSSSYMPYALCPMPYAMPYVCHTSVSIGPRGPRVLE